MRGFFKEKLEEEVSNYAYKFEADGDFDEEIPKCPEIKIDDRVLVQLS